MVHTASPTDPNLVLVTKAILYAARPRRIVLFGSRARGDWRADSDYDVMVELPDSADLRLLRTELSDAVRRIDPDVDLLVRSTGSFSRMCDDPGFVDWAIAREGVVLYQCPRAEPFETHVRHVREHREEWPSIANWLSRAEEDFLLVEMALAAPRQPWSAITYHAQQGAEKVLKALLVRHGIHPEKTHSLARILRALPVEVARKLEIAPQCELLDVLYPRSRYPGEYEMPGEADARAAISAAERIRVAALPLFRPNS